MSTQPVCWKCGSNKVTVVFVAYRPLYHKKGECTASCRKGVPCGESPEGRLTCSACGNNWVDGDITEYKRDN